MSSPTETADLLSQVAALKKDGNSHAGRSELDQAIKKYTAAIKLVGDSKDEELIKLVTGCKLNLAHCYLGKAEFQSCIEVCSMYIEQHGDHFKAYYRRGRAHKEMLDLESAKSDLTKAIELSPDEDEAILDALVEVEEAIEEHESLMSSDFMQKAREQAAAMTDEQKAAIKATLEAMGPDAKRYMMEQLRTASADKKRQALEEMKSLSPEELAKQAQSMNKKKTDAGAPAPKPPPPVPEEVKNFNFIYKFPERDVYIKQKLKYLENTEDVEEKKQVQHALLNCTCALLLKARLFQQAAPFCVKAQQDGKCSEERWAAFQLAKTQLDEEGNRIVEEAKLIDTPDIFPVAQQILQKKFQEENKQLPPNPALEKFNFIFAFPLKEAYDKAQAEYDATEEKEKEAKLSATKDALKRRTCDVMVKSSIYNQAGGYIVKQKQTGNALATEERWNAFQAARVQIETEMAEVRKAADHLVANWGTSNDIFKECDELLRKNPPQRAIAKPPPAPEHVVNFDFNKVAFPPIKDCEDAKAAFLANPTDGNLRGGAARGVMQRSVRMLQLSAMFRMSAPYIVYPKQNGVAVPEERWASFKKAEAAIMAEVAALKADADAVKPGWGSSEAIFKECDAMLKDAAKKQIAAAQAKAAEAKKTADTKAAE